MRRVLPRAARDAQHLRADADAAFVQSFNGNLVTLADFSEHVLLGNFAIFQNQFASGRGADAQLVFFLADRESGKILFDDESGDALVPSRRITRGEEHEDSSFLGIGDPQLAAVENVIAAFEFRLVCSANASEPEPASLKA